MVVPCRVALFRHLRTVGDGSPFVCFSYTPDPVIQDAEQWAASREAPRQRHAASSMAPAERLPSDVGSEDALDTWNEESRGGGNRSTVDDPTSSVSPPPAAASDQTAERLVKAARPSLKSKQHYDKVNACVFCGKLIKQKIKTFYFEAR